MIRWLTVALLAISVALPSGALTAQEQTIPRKSGSTALLWSLGGTLVPWVVGAAGSSDPASALLVTAGMLVGPSLGHFYAGRSGRAWASAGVRLGALVVMTAGVISCLGNLFDDVDCGAGASLALAGGGGLFIGSTIYDVATAPASARRFNKPHPVVGVVPVLQDGRMRVALVARFSF